MKASGDGTTYFAVDLDHYNDVAALGFIEASVPQQAYEEVEDDILTLLFEETVNVISSQEIVMAGLKGHFTLASQINDDGNPVNAYFAYTYNPNESKMVIAALSTTRDEDFTDYFNKMISDARLL